MRKNHYWKIRSRKDICTAKKVNDDDIIHNIRLENVRTIKERL